MVPASAGTESALLLSSLVSVVSVNLRARPSRPLEAECIINSSSIKIYDTMNSLFSEAVDHTHVPSP
jgi:hypothetical protein